jgi:DHA3 family macrolide efflux protein-like MFS transporter
VERPEVGRRPPVAEPAAAPTAGVAASTAVEPGSAAAELTVSRLTAVEVAAVDVAAPDALAPDVLAPDALAPDVLAPDVLAPDVTAAGEAAAVGGGVTVGEVVVRPPAGPRSLLNRSFVCVAGSDSVSRLGTVVFDFVLAWWLVRETGSSRYLGYLLAAASMPIVLLGPFGGVLADRWNRKWIMFWSDLAGGVAAAIVALMAYRGRLNLPVLILCTLALGICASISRPAMRAIVPVLIAKERLGKANSVTNNISEAAKVVGPMLGGMLIALPLVGIPGALLVNAISFWCSAALQLFVRYSHQERTGSTGMLVRLGEGMRYVWRHRLIRNMILLSGSVNFFLVSFNVLLPIYVRGALHQSAGDYSVALSAQALGGVTVTVAFLLARDIQPRPRLLAWPVAMAGVALGAIPLVPTAAGLAGLALAEGLFIAAFNTLFFTHVQQVVGEDFLGRTFSIIYMVAIAVMPASYLVFGYLGDYLWRWAFCLAGIGTVCCSLPFLFRRPAASALERAVPAG